MFYKHLQFSLLITLVSLTLSGCLVDDILVSYKTDYRISGLEEDPDTQSYLQKIMDERLVPPVEPLKDDEEKQRYDSYRERLIEGNLLKAMHAQGYYDAKIDFKDAPEQNAGVYDIDKGALYTISEISIKPKQFRQHIDALTINKGSILTARPVLKSQAEFYDAIQKDECYFNLDMSHKVILDKKTKTGRVIYDVDAGPKSVFDTVNFTGQETVNETYLKKLIPFKQGDCFRREKIEKLREELLATNLFARANIILPDTPAEGNKVPLNIDLKERAHRTIRAGTSYYTDEGAGIVLGWEHRNFFGNAEKLEAQLKASAQQQKVSVDLTKPFFLRKDQSLTLTAALDRQDNDAFNELSITSGANIKRVFNKRLSGQTGVEFKLTRIEDDAALETENFGLVSFPNALTFDSRNDKLNPREGVYINGIAEPFLDALGNASPFFKTRLSASTYYGITKDTVLAIRASVGSISGADIDDIPASERFYAGGGGSVRGFGYQDIGPQSGDDPTGGASVVEAAAEVRFKINDMFGAVAFVDAGHVNETAAPSFDTLSVGTGVGLRYYSPFGPLRFDVATPITNKENTDSNYQFYISIGQAF